MPEHTLFLIWMLGAPLCSSVRGYLEDLGHKALNTKPKQYSDNTIRLAALIEVVAYLYIGYLLYK